MATKELFRVPNKPSVGVKFKKVTKSEKNLELE